MAERVALVTGARHGIGRGIALRLAAEGFDLGLTAEAPLDETAALVRKEGRRAVAVVADFRKPSAGAAVVEQVAGELGRLDVLVNNAGFTLTKPIEETSEQDLLDTFSINFFAAYLAARAAIPHMRANGAGVVVNVSSIHSRLGKTGHSAYAATKGAMNAWTRQLAIELAGEGIRVNAVLPGLIETERYFDNPDYTSEKGGRLIPVGRPGTPADVAAAVAFLTRPEASFITGACLSVDGGSGAEMPIRIEEISGDGP